jgi:catechol 2,3-dioxygenase-like lactoylglutathione lyase family enzyme
MKIQRIDHVGIIVRDLAAARAFFVDLGLEVIGEGDVEGAWADRVTGLDSVKAAWVMLRTPDGAANIEFISFSSPADEGAIQQPSFNTLGIRHIAFAVEDIDAVVARLKKSGAEAFSEIQRFEDGYKLCFVRGPEGMIIELEEQSN